MINCTIIKGTALLARANSRSSQVLLLERKGRFFFYQPDSGLIASGDDVTSAYRKFENAQRMLHDDIEGAGLVVDVPKHVPAIGALNQIAPSSGIAIHRSAVAEIGLFVAKVALVLGLLGAAGAVALGAVEGTMTNFSERLARTLSGINSVSLADVVTKSEDIVRDFNSLPESRKEELRRNIGEISRQLSPIIETWNNPTAAPNPR